jgi:diguanylate cyclase (GGDEF)-like protein/PAS domain S-box-containing protein
MVSRTPEQGKVVDSTNGTWPRRIGVPARARHWLMDQLRRLDAPEPGARTAAHIALRGKTDHLGAAFQPAPVGIGIVDLEGHTTLTNEVLRHSLGYSPEEFAAMPFVAFAHPEDKGAALDLFAQMFDGQIDRFAMETRFIGKDGGTVWITLTVCLVKDADGNPDHAVGVTQDIADCRRPEIGSREIYQRSQLQVERVPAIVYVAEPGPNGRWLYVSPQIEAILGFSAHEWMDNPGLWLQQLHPMDQEDALAEEERHLQDVGAEGVVSSDTYRLSHRNGATVWVRDDAMMHWDSEGLATWHGVLVDVTAEKRLEELLEYQALHDPLTGLSNRKLFHDRVAHALLRRQAGQVGVLFIDLDNFKAVNDSFGHACGDEVLVAAAQRLQNCARAGDTAARIGGDEFALLVEDLTPAQATELADRVRDALRVPPLEFGRRVVVIEASVGIAVAGAGETTETLLRNADLAMYEAKLLGRRARTQGAHYSWDITGARAGH